MEHLENQCTNDYLEIAGDKISKKQIAHRLVGDDAKTPDGPTKRPSIHSDTYHEYLSSLDWGPGSRDHSSFKACLRAASLGISKQTAFDEITRRIAGTGGRINDSKLKSQLQRAFKHVTDDVQEVIVGKKSPAPVYSEETMSDLAAKVPQVDFHWLVQASPIDVSTVSSATFLESLYEPGENVIWFTNYKSQGQGLYTVGDPKTSSLPDGGPEGVWFMSNPVDGENHPNPRQEGKLSFRSEESVTDWRYLVLESDTVDQDQWIRCLVQLPLKIVAVYTSGGRSIHALVRIDATSKADWDAQKNRIKLVVVPLGADLLALTAVRLTRLPGTLRGTVPQQLLYLNPAATNQPIFK